MVGGGIASYPELGCLDDAGMDCYSGQGTTSGSEGRYAGCVWDQACGMCDAGIACAVAGRATAGTI